MVCWKKMKVKEKIKKEKKHGSEYVFSLIWLERNLRNIREIIDFIKNKNLEFFSFHISSNLNILFLFFSLFFPMPSISK